jgi:hypothetical protein
LRYALGVDTPGKRVLAARILAVVADGVQLGLMPLFVEGALSTANDVLDVVVAAAMTVLVGWHWAFLPAFVVELVPGFDLVPTWTAAVILATRGAASAEPGPPPGPTVPPPAGPAAHPSLPPKGN